MFWRKKRPLSDFEEEIRSHLAHEADDLRQNGVNSSEDAARRAFGNITSAKESFYEHGRWMVWDQLSRDLRHAWRLFWRRPAFSAVVVLTLAIGIGANTAIFSVINAVLLRPLPYKDPYRLAMIWSEDSAHGLHEGRVSLLNFADWKKRSRTFEDMTAFIGQTFLLGNNDGPPERMRSARVSANFFTMLGVQPHLGRVFTAEEEQRGDHVVVLGYSLWMARFGGSAQILGSDLTMDGRKATVIGVMPSSFRYPFADTQVWEPMTAHPYWMSRDRVGTRSAANWYVLGKIRPQLDWANAQAEMNQISRHLQSEYPGVTMLPDIRIAGLQGQTSGRVRLSLAVLFGSVLMMLLIACINVANLLLARGSAREREFAVRRTLGASRLRVAAQLLMESLVLSAVGGVAGLAVAALMLKGVVIFGPQEIPRLAETSIDGTVLCFTLGLSLFAAIFAGLWPALRSDITISRSRQWTTVANRSVRNALVIGEFAISLILLAAAGLMLRSFVQLQSADPGFRPEKMLVMRVDLHVGRTATQEIQYFQQAIERLRLLPGIESAAAISGFLFTDPEDAVAIDGRPPQQPGPCDDLVAGPFLQTAGIPLKKGRYFTGQDTRNAPPVAIINETMARTYWADADPIGRRFQFSSRKSSPWVTVVGVAGDMRRQGLENQVLPQVFRPHAQDADDMMEVLVRTSGDPAEMIPAVRRTIQQIDPSVAKFEIHTVEDRLKEQTAQRLFQTSLIGVFSLIALFLSAIGIYGLMHYLVVQRTHELGVRMALGAHSSDVLKLILRQGIVLTGWGVVIGVPIALAVTRWLVTLLYGVKPADPVTFVAAPAILMAVAAVASWVPARRAALMNPVLALRQD